jgi:hypothetical protein
MKTIFKASLIALTLMSCGRNTSNTELLTSSRWVFEPTANDDTTKTETLKFAKNGTYTLEAGDLKVDGKWSSKTDDEIYLIVEGITSDNGTAKFDKTSNYNVRILEISDKSLRILEKGEDDSWDSGFAKEKKYTAKQ